MQVPRSLESEVILYWHGSCQGNAACGCSCRAPEPSAWGASIARSASMRLSEGRTTYVFASVLMVACYKVRDGREVRSNGKEYIRQTTTIC